MDEQENDIELEVQTALNNIKKENFLILREQIELECFHKTEDKISNILSNLENKFIGNYILYDLENDGKIIIKPSDITYEFYKHDICLTGKAIIFDRNNYFLKNNSNVDYSLSYNDFYKLYLGNLMFDCLEIITEYDVNKLVHEQCQMMKDNINKDFLN